MTQRHPTLTAEQDAWLSKLLLTLSLCLVMASYGYRIVVTDRSYATPNYTAKPSTLVQTEAATQYVPESSGCGRAQGGREAHYRGPGNSERSESDDTSGLC